MEEQVTSTPGDPVNPQNPVTVVVDVIDLLAERQEDDLRAFRGIGDRFIDAANAAISGSTAGRVSSAFMHACTRFNVFVMQERGLPVMQTNDAEVADFLKAYRYLLDYHAQEILIAPNA